MGKDLTGQTIGYLTVLERCPERPRGPSGRPYLLYRCRCICGKELTVSESNLTKAIPQQSCGCRTRRRREPDLKTMIGRRYGCLTIMERLDIPGTDGSLFSWRCQCRCGNEIICSFYDLFHGVVKDCGCDYKAKKAKEKRKR